MVNSGTTLADTNGDELYGAASIDPQDDLQRILELSRAEAQRNEALRKQEEDEMDQILRLSLIEK
jgi:hypothetical protein